MAASSDTSPFKLVIDPQIGLELTWLPIPKCRGALPEWTDQCEANERVAAFNKALDLGINRGRSTPLFRAKTDVFRTGLCKPADGYPAWCMEINSPSDRVIASDLIDSSDIGSRFYVTSYVHELYDLAAKHGLTPCHIHKARNGEVTEYPSGGGHLHVGIDFWGEGAWFLIKLLVLERCLLSDYVNNPVIRWCFAQWMDDRNSELGVNLKSARRLARLLRQRKITRPQAAVAAADWTLNCHTIKQRFAETGKNQYPTYEFRFFDMPRRPEDLTLQVRFLINWINFHVSAINECKGSYHTLSAARSGYTLTPAYFQRVWKDVGFARAEAGRFWRKIGLDIEDYTDLCFDQHLIPRLRHGKPL